VTGVESISLIRSSGMKRNLVFFCIAITVTLATCLAFGKNKKGAMSGTWDCQAHGGSQGDTAFTLFLQQNKETVDGSIASPIGSTQISSGTFRRNMLEIHLDTPQGPYVLIAKFEKGKLSGTWSMDSDKGIWEGKKHAAGSE
jgi:hypothetical protein